MSRSSDTRRLHENFTFASQPSRRRAKRSQRQRAIRLEPLEARLALASDLAELLQLPDEKFSLPRPADWLNVPSSPAGLPGQSGVTRNVVPGELLFSIAGKPTAEALQQTFSQSLQISRLDLGGGVDLLPLLMLGDDQQTLVRLQLGQFQDVAAAAEVVRGTIPGVLWAEPNYSYEGNLLEFAPNDTFYAAYNYNHLVMQNDLAWDTTLGSPNVVIAVIDNGLQLDHPDITPNIYLNPGEVFGNGIDDDGNGFIDDLGGWDFVTNDNNVTPVGVNDSHGTAVAGALAARTNNAAGISGVAGGSRIMPIRVLGSDAALTSTALLNGLRYAADNGADIVNTSLDFDLFVGDAAVTAAVQYVYDRNVLQVASAGNGQEENPLRQAFTQPLFVAGTNTLDIKAGYSNYGTGIDLSAPSELVPTTVLASGYALINPEAFIGTSMASAMVSGAAALVWSANPALTRDQVAARLVGTTNNIDALNPNYVGLLGTGRVNSNRAINAVLAAPQIRQLREVPTTNNPTIFPISRLNVGLLNVLSKTTVETAANWSLVGAGPDDTFNTPDDIGIPLLQTNPYFVGANDVTFSFPTLSPGSYRFTAVSGGLRDPFNTALDGDANGTAGGNFVKDFRVSAGNIAFVADFSDAVGAPQSEGFTTSGPASAWKLSTGRGNDPGHSTDDSLYFGTGESAAGGGSYSNSADGTVSSPVIDLSGYSGTTLLEFNHFLSSEVGFDFASVRIIEGGGVRQIAISGDQFPHNTTGFEHVALDISEFVGRSITVQFRFTSNATTTAEGWYVDDITIRSLGTAPVANLSGQVWNDLNGNRARDAGENGLAGWTVFLDANNNGTLDTTVNSVASTDVPRTISDFNFIESNLVVAGLPGNILDLDVSVNITHTYTSDLDLILTSPTGFQLLLVGEEGADGDNFANTRFDDEAALSIVGAAAPFTGSFRPEGLVLSALDGTNPNGTWKLEIRDFGNGDTGTLASWSLHITTAEQSRVTDASGNYSFTNVPAGTHVIREVLQATWNQSLPVAGFHTVTPTGGQTLTNLDFANSQGPIQPATFLVTTSTPTTTGVVLDFNRNLDLNTLNLYDVQSGTLGPADLVLTGGTVGEIRGSAVIDPNLRRLTFVTTVGRLPADTYTLTLRSAADGFRDATSELLDGDANGTAGGNYSTTFTVTAPPANAVTIGLPNLARGPQQAVNVPASAVTGLPLSFSNGGGITSANFELRYDPTLLTITGATVAPGLTGATVNLNTGTPGVAVIQFSSPTPLAAGTTRFLDLQANVPTTAPYRAKHVLNLSNIVLNGGAVPGLDDDAVHAIAYFGDTTGNGTYSSLDASQELRMAVALDRGFFPYRLLDPIIVGDITGNNAFSATDASASLQLGVGLSVPEVPALPAVGSLTTGGPDPKLSIPHLSGTAGSSVAIPVMIDSIVDLTGNGLLAADVVLYFDPRALTIDSVRPGSLIELSNWILATNIDPLAGRMIVSVAGTSPLEGFFQGELIQISATVNADAPAGSSALNIAASARDPQVRTQLNEGYLTLIPAPTDSPRDAIDGSLMVIRPANDPVVNQPTARILDGRLLILGTAANDRVFVSELKTGEVRVRVGGQLLGDFEIPGGIVIDANRGRDFVYVSPQLPRAVVVADRSAGQEDAIFGGDNVWTVDESTVAPVGARDLAILALLDQWSAGSTGSGRSPSRVLTP